MKREFDIIVKLLEYLAEDESQPQTNTDIADKLSTETGWGKISIMFNLALLGDIGVVAKHGYNEEAQIKLSWFGYELAEAIAHAGWGFVCKNTSGNKYLAWLQITTPVFKRFEALHGYNIKMKVDMPRVIRLSR